MNKTTCVYDTNCTIAGNSFTKENYDFVNWAKDSATGTTYNAGATVKNLATSGNVDMYAIWEESLSQFGKDDWETIAANVKSGNTDKYNVGDTKEVDLGTLGTHTVRIANKSECTTETSETACGFVVEFADIITKQQFNSTKTNKGGWRDSKMRTYINDTVYKSLPSDLQNVIISTKVISGHGSTSGETNFETQDKLYLLSNEEIWEDFASSSKAQYDTSVGTSKQLDYYKNQRVTENNYAGSNKQYNGSNSWWWLRSAISHYADNFIGYGAGGNWDNQNANKVLGVSPAFRLQGPTAFQKDDWSTIAANVKSGNTDKYNVGDTKKVTLASHTNDCSSSSGEGASYVCNSSVEPERELTVRIANKSECTNGETSETACGFVVEFVDIIENHNYNKADATNKYGINVGGWKASELRTYINDTIYKSLPSELQNVIATTKVISGHGSTSGETNFETQDKLYLLSSEEIWEDFASSTNAINDASVGTSKQLDYYKNQGVTTSSYAGAIKQYNGSNSYWWLRSASSSITTHFLIIVNSGDLRIFIASDSYGVSPAFRIA